VVTNTIPMHTAYVPGSATTTQGTVLEADPLRIDVGDVAPGGEVTISFQATVDDPGLACWFVRGEAVVRSEDIEHTYSAYTVVGECNKVYIPLVQR